MVPTPIGTDSTTGIPKMSSSMYKIQPDQSMKKSVVGFSDVGSKTTYSTPFVKATKKRLMFGEKKVNFDLPRIQKAETIESDEEHEELNRHELL